MNFTRLPDLCVTEQQVDPVQGKRENKAGLLSWRVLASLFIAVLFLQVNPIQAQWIAPNPDWHIEGKDVNPPCKNCVAEDIKAVDFWFKGYNNLNGCLDSTTKIVSDGLVVSLDVTAKERYGLMFVANLHVDSGNGEKFVRTLYYCQKRTYQQGPVKDTINFDVTSLNLRAGFKVTLHDVFVAWDNNNPNGPKKDYLVCQALHGTNVQGVASTWQFDCTMFEYGAKNGVSLTPRCKRYTDVFLIKTPIRPIIHLKELNDESCFSGSEDGSISVKVYPLWQQYTYGYIFKWFNEAGTDISANSSRTYTTSDLENLSAGDYKFVAIVNVGTKQCTDTAVFTVDVAPEILDSLSKKNAICDGENGYAFVAEISGGTPFEEGSPYQYYWSSNRNFSDTLNEDNSADTLFGIAAGKYFLSIRDANGCEKIDSITVGNDPCPIAGVFCTYTQGYFGTDNPGKATYDNGDGCQKTETRGTILASLSWWNEREKTGDSLKVGNINLSRIGDTLAMERILDYLPGGGPSYRWTESDFPKSETPYQYRNTLISQTLTLGLNIGLNKDLADFELPETLYLRHTGSCDGEEDDDEDEDEDYTTIHEYAVDEDFVGKTPLEIFKAASAALLENTSDNSTRTKYAGIAGFLNEAFDECAAVIDLSEVPGSKTQKATTVQTAGASNFEVKAYPNPFTNLVNFSFKAPVAGEVTVEIFDMTGRRLDIIRKTSTFAGQQSLIQFRANQTTAGQLLYKVSVGNYSVLGKLVNAKN